MAPAKHHQHKGKAVQQQQQQQQQQPQAVQLQEEEDECPLCIGKLDATERQWLPCACGYQLCLFCYGRIKTEFNNQCPGCRTPYDEDFQAGLQRRKQQVASAAAEAKPRPAPAAAAPEAPAPAAEPAARTAGSSGRDLQIGEEQEWPTLAAPPAEPARAPVARPPPPVETRAAGAGAGSSSGSEGTGGTTPRSPAGTDSVITFRASFRSGGGAAASPVRGTCLVSLSPTTPAAGVAVDVEGAALVARLQDSVMAGRLSVMQASAVVVQHLRSRAAAARPDGGTSAGPGPTNGTWSGCSQPSGGGTGLFQSDWEAPAQLHRPPPRDPALPGHRPLYARQPAVQLSGASGASGLLPSAAAAGTDSQHQPGGLAPAPRKALAPPPGFGGAGAAAGNGTQQSGAFGGYTMFPAPPK